MTGKFKLNYSIVTIFLGIVLSILLNPSLAADSQSEVQVSLFEAHRPVYKLEIIAPFILLSTAGNLRINHSATAYVEAGRIKLITNVSRQAKIIASAQRIIIKGVELNCINLSISSLLAKRKYHGRIFIIAGKDGSLEIINHVSQEDYIVDVVASEAPLLAPLEMLKAQAILVQTILAKNRQDTVIGDSTERQVYLGASLEREPVRMAVDTVFWKKLFYKGTPALIYYHSTCAGGTSDGAKFFHLPKGSVPYLRAVKCEKCFHSPFCSTTCCYINDQSFARVFGCTIPKVIEKDYTGRPIFIKLADGKNISGYDFWIRLGQAFGWDKAPGTRFQLAAGTHKDIIVKSTGAGHGVGLCQWGACEMAKQGKNFKEILSFYFPGCYVR